MDAFFFKWYQVTRRPLPTRLASMQDGTATVVTHDPHTRMYYFECPHCHAMCQVHHDDIRCTIFRHAVWKAGNDRHRFVPSHASQEECERWVREDAVWGCTKPFRFDGKRVEICDYL